MLPLILSLFLLSTSVFKVDAVDTTNSRSPLLSVLESNPGGQHLRGGITDEAHHRLLGKQKEKKPKKDKKDKAKKGSKGLKCPNKEDKLSTSIDLTVSVKQITQLLKSKDNGGTIEIGSGAPVYLAAVLEYLLVELLKLAGNAARAKTSERVTSEHVWAAIKNNEEFNKLLGDVKIVAAVNNDQDDLNKLQGDVLSIEDDFSSELFDCYIQRIFDQIQPDLEGVKKDAKKVLSAMIYDIYDRLSGEAFRLAKFNTKAILSSREIQTAVRLTLPGELAKHAVSEGTKAVIKFSSNT